MLQHVKSLFSGAYSGISRDVWLLSAVMLINRSGTMVIFFLSVYLTEKLGFSVQQTGVVMACFGAGSFTGAFTGGKLTDIIGYHPVMLISLFTGGTLFMLIPFIHSYLYLCVSFFFLSIFSESYRPANMTAIAFYSKPGNYTRSISINRLAINLGFSVGPVLGGFLASISYDYLFYTNGCFCIAAATFTLFMLHNKKVHHVHGQSQKQQIASPYKDKIYLYFIVAVFLYALCFFQFFITMPLFYKDIHHLSERQIGLLMMFNGLIVAVVEMILVYRLEKRWNVYRTISIGGLLLAATYLCLPFIGGFAAFTLIIVLVSFSEMLAMPFMNSFMNLKSSIASRGQYAALYSMAWSSAQTALPILATQTIANFGYNTLWMLLAFILIIMTYIIRVVSQKMRAAAAN
ncbi:MAG TPA: MFS transporter [Bacteroidia bacterium]|nr:MFS transporter [Bacteroidia bacterium]HMX97001.1 MFS transporter [Bacteroidia bacterium]HNI30169.1 MFS transporter [Bacteroidia bacterium]HNJ31487.1 MFS transporter [Bacteroidia bacterium]HNL34563.1 MFS transporter [Bacteroidia bacterium]